MFSIGTFSQFSAVSIRTLRHYDEIGLFPPAFVDPSTGYRYYEAAQLIPLNRIVVLKELGFTLAEITRMTESAISSEQLLGMLRLRQSQAERDHIEGQRRLKIVATRIARIEKANDMQSTNESSQVVVKPLPGMRLAVASEPAEGFDSDFGPIFQRLYPHLTAELGQAGVAPTSLCVALYDERSDGRIDVVAGFGLLDGATISSGDVSTRIVAPVERAATLIHRGPMETIKSSYEELMGWMADAGEEATGFSREIYLDMDGAPESWVTELQFALK